MKNTNWNGLIFYTGCVIAWNVICLIRHIYDDRNEIINLKRQVTTLARTRDHYKELYNIKNPVIAGTVKITPYLMTLFMKLPDSERICIICQDQVENSREMHIRKCSHIFHKRCNADWTKRSRECPTCREI